MDLTIVAALSDNGVIGIENKIPWRIKEDMERFKKLTMNHPVIMGRKTYDSIPEKFRPLPGRENIVLSRTLQSKKGIYIAKNMDESLKLTNGVSSYVMGGAKIYKLFLPLANVMELTKVHKNFDGDTFFPNVDWDDWNLINEEKKKNEEGLSFSFLTYQRIR